MTAAATGAHFEIKVDGVVRSYRDERDTAIEAARYLRQRNPGAKIAVTDLRDGSPISFVARHGAEQMTDRDQERRPDRPVFPPDWEDVTSTGPRGTITIIPARRTEP